LAASQFTGDRRKSPISIEMKSSSLRAPRDKGHMLTAINAE
jgi:hypothetical protein